jgi:hypothetical protein
MLLESQVLPLTPRRVAPETVGLSHQASLSPDFVPEAKISSVLHGSVWLRHSVLDTSPTGAAREGSAAAATGVSGPNFRPGLQYGVDRCPGPSGQRICGCLGGALVFVAIRSVDDEAQEGATPVVVAQFKAAVCTAIPSHVVYTPAPTRRGRKRSYLPRRSARVANHPEVQAQNVLMRKCVHG